MPRRAHSLALLPLALLLGCEVSPSNAFDPDTPREFQALGRIKGLIQAVHEPSEDGSVPEASFCPRRPGDHSGFSIILRGLVSDDEDSAIRAQSAATFESGAFVFEGVPAGSYAVEIVRPGFTVPLPRTIEVLPGETRVIPPLCAIDQTPPPAPLLGALPAAVGEVPPGEPAAVLSILESRPDARYTVEQLPDGDASGAPAPLTLTGDGATLTAPLDLVSDDAAPARRTWRVRVTASDALGNTSEATEATVVRDTLAPPAPGEGDLRARAGADRVSAAWPLRAEANDDPPASWLVSYGLVPRPYDETAACPWGRPLPPGVDDPLDNASFALEGESPLLVGLPEATLSGILPGTEVYLHVAAVDAVGNRSCYGPPVIARPDEVTPALDPLRAPTVVGNARAVATRDGASAWAAGASGLTVVDRSGSAHVVDDVAIADAVVFVGPRLYVAAGAGVARVAVDASGAPAEIDTIDAGTDRVLALAARPGALWLGTGGVSDDGGGLRRLPLADGAALEAEVLPGGHDAPTAHVASFADALVLVREPTAASGTSAPRRLQVVDASDPTVVRGETSSLPGAVTRLVVVGTRAFALTSGGARLFDLSSCLAGATGCLGPPRVLELPGAVSPVDVAAFDDLVLLLATGDGSDPGSGGVFLYATEPGLRLVGRAFLPSPSLLARHLLVEDTGFCLVGSDDGSDAAACYSTAALALPSRQVRVVGRGTVRRVTSHGPAGYLAEDIGEGAGATGAVTRFALATGAVEQHFELPPHVDGPVRVAALSPLAGLGAVVLDDRARLFLAPLAAGPSSPTTPDALAPVSGAGDESFADALVALLPGFAAPVHAFSAVDGDALYLSLLAASGDGALLRVPLVEEAGALAFGAPEAVPLGALDDVTGVLLEGGRAYVSTFPAGVVVVDVADPSAAPAVLSDEGIAPGEGPGEGAVEVFALPASPVTRVIFLSDVDDGSGALSARLDELLPGGEMSRLAADLPGRRNAAAALGAYIAIAGRGEGAMLYERTLVDEDERWLPVLQVPSVPTFTHMAPTRRGLLLGDGPSGAEWTVIR